MLPDFRLVIAALFTTLLFVGVSFSIFATLRSAQMKQLTSVTPPQRSTLAEQDFAAVSVPPLQNSVEDGRALTALIAEVAAKERSEETRITEPAQHVAAPADVDARQRLLPESTAQGAGAAEPGEVTGSITPPEASPSTAHAASAKKQAAKGTRTAPRIKKRASRKARRAPVHAQQPPAPSNPFAAMFGGAPAKSSRE